MDARNNFTLCGIVHETPVSRVTAKGKDATTLLLYVSDSFGGIVYNVTVFGYESKGARNFKIGTEVICKGKIKSMVSKCERFHNTSLLCFEVEQIGGSDEPKEESNYAQRRSNR